MPENEPFPWDLLKAECLRVVCGQLVQGSKEGGHYPPLGRKEEMINFLRDVETLGLEPAVQKIDIAPRKTNNGDSEEGGNKTKRKGSENDDAEGEAEEDGSSSSTHNTRYKGAKRVKLTKEDKDGGASASVGPKKSGPGRPRKSTDGAADGAKRGRGRPRKSETTTIAVKAKGKKENEEEKEEKDEEAPEPSSAKKPRVSRPKAPPPTDENGMPIKRGRGRPRKNADAAAAPASGAADGEGEGETSAPPSKGKAVFEGVVLNKRRSSIQEESPDNADAQQATTGPSEAAKQADAAEEHDVVLAVINGQNIEADASNQGNSDPNSMNVDDGHDADADADADADGDPDPQVITA